MERPGMLAAARDSVNRRPEMRFGPAGWSYEDWRGRVYPSPEPPGWRPLDLLTGLFDALEVNATFYRDVPAGQVERWCREVASRPRFRWSFKVHRRFSHQGAPPLAADLLPYLDLFAPAREQGRLGALLLQFPWSLRPTAANRERLAGTVAEVREAGWPLVVEVRHAGWGAALPFAPVVLDQPALRGCLAPEAALEAALSRREAESPAPAAAAAVPAPAYVRLHGRNGRAWFAPDAGRDQRYDYLYTPAERTEWLERLERLHAQAAGGQIYVITNNHYQGQAVVDALVLQALWSGRRPPIPPELRRSFPADLRDFPLRGEPGRQPTLFG